MTRAELTVKVASLHAVGGLYELIALYVEHDNAPHCTDSETPLDIPLADH